MRSVHKTHYSFWYNRVNIQKNIVKVSIIYYKFTP